MGSAGASVTTDHPTPVSNDREEARSASLEQDLHTHPYDCWCKQCQYDNYDPERDCDD